MERAETKRWLKETLDTLMKERAGEEKKEENRKLDLIMDRHTSLIPKVQETLVKTECYWKCYSYGDDLIPIFEFIDDLRNRSIKEVLSGNHEQTEEHIEKQDKVIYHIQYITMKIIHCICKDLKSYVIFSPIAPTAFDLESDKNCGDVKTDSNSSFELHKC